MNRMCCSHQWWTGSLLRVCLSSQAAVVLQPTYWLEKKKTIIFTTDKIWSVEKPDGCRYSRTKLHVEKKKKKSTRGSIWVRHAQETQVLKQQAVESYDLTMRTICATYETSDSLQTHNTFYKRGVWKSGKSNTSHFLSGRFDRRGENAPPACWDDAFCPYAASPPPPLSNWINVNTEHLVPLPLLSQCF